jgi:hypothetical protein
MPTQMPINKDSEDAGWTHVRETVRMLFLSIAQIEIALHESDASVEHLTEAFTSMVEREDDIVRAMEKLSANGVDQSVCESIKLNAEEVAEKMQGAIVAFQFYDRLTQRLAHVGSSMEALSALMEDDERLHDASEWGNLQSVIKSKYSMREEHELFDVVMAGGGVRDAIRHFNEAKKDETHNDIELF